MSTNFNKRRGLYLGANEETDQDWQEFHQQFTQQAEGKAEPEDDFPQLKVRGGLRSPVKEAPPAESVRPPPSKPLPGKPPARTPGARPPSASQPAIPVATPPSPGASDDLLLNSRTKSPMRPQGIRANGTSSPVSLVALDTVCASYL